MASRGRTADRIVSAEHVYPRQRDRETERLGVVARSGESPTSSETMKRLRSTMKVTPSRRAFDYCAQTERSVPDIFAEIDFAEFILPSSED